MLSAQRIIMCVVLLVLTSLWVPAVDEDPLYGNHSRSQVLYLKKPQAFLILDPHMASHDGVGLGRPVRVMIRT